MFIGNTVKKIKDTDFLRVKWGKKNKAIKEAVTVLNRHLQSRAENKITSDYPEYLTFFQAERLFQVIQQLTDDSNTVTIKKLELFHQEDGKKPSNKNEAYAENIKLDGEFISLLVPLMQSVFSNKDIGFKKATYEDKCAYFERSIFESYIESVGIGRQYLPLLPDKTSVEEALKNKTDITIGFSQEFPVLIDIEDEVSEEDAEFDGEDILEDPNDLELANFLDGSYSPEETDTVPEVATSSPNEVKTQEKEEAVEISEDIEVPEVPSASELFEQDNTPEVDNRPVQKSVPTTPEKLPEEVFYEEPKRPKKEEVPPVPKKVLEPQVTDDLVRGSVYRSTSANDIEPPLFVIKDFSKEKYEPYEDEYVEWKINEFKKDFNQQLKKRNDLVREYAQETIKQELNEFEQDQLSQINSELQSEDNRYSLKENIIKDNRKLEFQEQQEKENILEKEKNQALEQENQRHKARVQEIEADFESKKHESKHLIHQKYFNEAQRLYQEQMLMATNRLDMLVQNKMEELAKRKAVKEEELITEKKALSRQIVDKLFKNKQEKLERIKPLLSEEHVLAKKKYLIDEAKNLEKREREDTLRSNELLRNQVKELAETNNKAAIDKFESERKLLHEKEKSFMDKMELMSKVQMMSVNRTEGSSNKSKKASESNKNSDKKRDLKSLLLVLVISILAIALGGFGIYRLDQQQADIQKTIESQQKTVSEIQKQKAEASSQSKKKAAESKAKAESESKQRFSEMEKEVSSLKAKEQSSAQVTKEN
ncbi:hypothetical protein AB9M75_11875 [Lactobacillus sp. AN1001]